MFTISRTVIKLIIGFTIWFNLSAACPAIATPVSLKISSFNIQYIQPRKNPTEWDTRKDAVIRLLKSMGADLIAFQEMETFEGSSFSYRNLQLDWVLQNLPDYSPAAVGNPERYPSTQPILYLKSKFEVEEQGFFFFSKNPDQIYSRQWDGSYPYFCSWVRFKHLKSGQTLTLFNIHNDYSSRDNRAKTSRLIVERVRPLLEGRKPLLIVGDFNAPSWGEPLRILKEAGLELAEPSGSTHHFNRGLNLLPAIDHVFGSPEITFEAPIKIWRNKFNGVWPSDHYSISVEVHLK